MAVRDPELTKARIMAAALREFSAKGIAGSRIEAIESRAKVNRRMLYHYFGSKVGLFRAIWRDQLGRAPVIGPEEASQPERLARWDERLEQYHDYVRLLMWEALQTAPDRHLEDEDERREFYGRWIDSVRADQDAGVLPDDMDPAHRVLCELAVTLVPVAFPQLTRLITGYLPTDPEFQKERRRCMDALARRLDIPAQKLPAAGRAKRRPGTAASS